MTCKTCRFWEREDKWSSFGACKRHAPIADNTDRRLLRVWPVTFDVAWCGDHEPKKENA